jgi:hypothetical protein
LAIDRAGKVAAEDVEDVVIPAIVNSATSGEVRFVIVIHELRGMDPGALWEDLKVSFENFPKWKRIALTADVEWLHHLTAPFGWTTLGDARTFPTIEQGKPLRGC